MIDHQLLFSGLAVSGAWAASIGATITDGGAVGALTLAFSAALTMLWVGQRRQRLMLIESNDLARRDRDECRRELAALKDWIANNLEQRSEIHRD